MTCPDADTFNAFARGDLPIEVRAGLADHAATCVSCHDVLGALVAPERVGRYLIEEPIGAGAMGIVYAARDPELDRRVAIKLMRGGPGERLRREAQLLARLHHPNVVSVFDAGEHDGQAFVAMALVDGTNLRTWLATPRSQAEIMRVILDVARGLGAAHAAGVIHRDVKPDNIFVGKDGVAQVGDFGLAQLATDDDTDDAGTPAYMASDPDATVASDQFSLCVTAWEALTGERPFAGSTLREIRESIRAGKITKPARDLAARVRAALERGLAPSSDARWPSIDALAAALAPRPRRWPIVAGVLAAGIAVCAVLVTRGGDRCAATAHELDAIAFADLPPASRELANAYGRDWLAIRREVCATDGAEVRTRCLDRARDALAELVHTAGSADPDAASRAVFALPVLSECRTALEGNATPAQLRAGEDLLSRLSRAATHADLGGHGAIDEVHALAAEADKLGFEPAIVMAATIEARALARAGQGEAATNVLRTALGRAEAAHDDAGVATIAAELAPIDIDLSRLDDAKAMIELAVAAMARGGEDPEVDVRIIDARALLAVATGDHASAIALIRSVLEHPMPDSQRIQLDLMLSREAAAAGRFDDARAAIAAADALDLGKLGSGADEVALGDQVNDAILAGDTPRALANAERMAALARAHHHPEYEALAALLVARAYDATDNLRGQRDAYAHLLALLDATPDGGNPNYRAIANSGVGVAMLRLGDPKGAIPLLRASLVAFASTTDAHGDEAAYATIALAEALVDTGEAAEARTLLEPLLRALTDDPDAFVHRRGSAEFQLARALWDSGDDRDRTRAKTLADAARGDYEAAVERARTLGNPVAIQRFHKRLDDIATWLSRRH